MFMRKILFLDIDGVINSQSTTDFKNKLWPTDPYMAFLAGKIQLDTGCEIVLSTSWRHHPDGLAETRKLFNISDITPLLNGFRGAEVNQWLVEHGQDVERYACLDDSSDFWFWQPLFQTTFENGLTEEIAGLVTKYLNGELPYGRHYRVAQETVEGMG
jgi:hypothetical protein